MTSTRVDVQYRATDDIVVLTFREGDEVCTYEFSYINALLLHREIDRVCLQLRGSRVACDAVGRVARAAAVARQER